MRRRIHACHMRRRIHACMTLLTCEEDTCMSYEEEDTFMWSPLHASHHRGFTSYRKSGLIYQIHVVGTNCW
jgi:hypothetical protein